MMKIVIVGGGMVGMTLAHLLRRRGVEPTVLERAPAGHYIPRGYMLGFQGYDPLQEIGVLDEMRREGWDIAPREDGTAVAIAVEVGKLIHALQRDLDVQFEHSIVGLVKDGEGRVVASLRAEGDAAVLRVDDDGPGVPLEDRGRIFEPMVRLDAARGRDAGGVGMGLALARRIARRHGGDLVVESSDLGGASFVLSVPLAAPDVRPGPSGSTT